MRVACLLIPHFAVELELLEHPEFRGRPVILGGAPHESPVVIDCSEEARRYGVEAGLQVRQAFARCYHAVFLEARSTLYEEMNVRLYKALYQFSPQVEIARPGCFFVNSSGLSIDPANELGFIEKLAQAMRQAVGIQPRAAISSGKFSAYAAAVQAAQPRVVPVQDVAGFVSTLPAHHLPVSDEMKRQLRFLGLATLRDVARLPKTAMLAEFGKDGQTAWELSQGIDNSSVHGLVPPTELRDQITFEEPVATTSGLLMGVNVLLSRLGERLAAEGRSARGLRLRVKLTSRRTWQQQVNFREATSNVQRMLLNVKSVVERQQWRAAAEEMEVLLWHVHPAGGTQPDLFAERNGAQQRIEAALRHLSSRYKHVPVYHVIEPNPLSRLSERRFALAACEPDSASPCLKALGQPEHVHVRATELGQPQAVLWRNRWLAVIDVAEEWRLDEEWWRAELIRRYFRALLANGRQLILCSSDSSWQRYLVNEIEYLRAQPLIPRRIEPVDGQPIPLPKRIEDDDRAVPTAA